MVKPEGEGRKKKPETTIRLHDASISAVAELKDLLDAKTKKQNLKNVLLEEITLLEEDIALRTQYIQTLVDKL